MRPCVKGVGGLYRIGYLRRSECFAGQDIYENITLATVTWQASCSCDCLVESVSIHVASLCLCLLSCGCSYYICNLGLSVRKVSLGLHVGKYNPLAVEPSGRMRACAVGELRLVRVCVW